ncbi:lactate utilization protein C [Pseudoalteromonas sp.]|jgi:L-lactate dehydrogenase complex protein LldG|uniref:LutC/YkgG family protein n=1 Tax=Pseudoalteromonas sp. TaxID=53249 RepID=UPI00356490B5
MSNARSRILDKLKQQIQQVDYNKLPQEHAVSYEELTPQQSLAQFTTQLKGNHAQVIQVTRETLAEHLYCELKKRNINHLLYGEQCQYTKDIEQLNSAITLEKYDFDFNQHKERLFDQVAAGITSSRCAIAQTGTIVLWPTIAEPRTLSLVPPVHFVIVDSQTLYATFSELLEKQQWHNKLPTNVVLISGPSKTADIQQTLAYGAHGPKELIVFIV